MDLTQIFVILVFSNDFKKNPKYFWYNPIGNSLRALFGDVLSITSNFKTVENFGHPNTTHKTEYQIFLRINLEFAIKQAIVIFFNRVWTSGYSRTLLCLKLQCKDYFMSCTYRNSQRLFTFTSFPSFSSSPGPPPLSPLS